MILSELKRNPQNSFEPVCIVDDDTTKFKRTIQGVPIMGTTDDVARLCDQYSVDAILFAIANISLKEKNRIINLCAATKKEVNIIPDLYKVMTGQEVPVGTIRQVEVTARLRMGTSCSMNWLWEAATKAWWKSTSALSQSLPERIRRATSSAQWKMWSSSS